MRIKVLGAGAGGGLPQWNCGCRNCSDARTGRIAGMSQSSVAVTAQDNVWVLLNASPDIRSQLAADGDLAPPGLRGAPLAAVVLTNGDVDHVAGLLTLREKSAFEIVATRQTLAILADNAIFGVLDPALVTRRPLDLDRPVDLAPGLTLTAYAVPGKVALYLEGPAPDLRAMGEQTVGLRLDGNGRVVHYIPGCAEVTDALIDRLADSDLVLFDGTVWRNDEMPATGTGAKTGARMGHVAMSGPGGSLERLADLRARRVYVHINNTNPVLQPDSLERRAVAEAGWEIAADGMEILP